MRIILPTSLSILSIPSPQIYISRRSHPVLSHTESILARLIRELNLQLAGKRLRQVQLLIWIWILIQPQYSLSLGRWQSLLVLIPSNLMELCSLVDINIYRRRMTTLGTLQRNWNEKRLLIMDHLTSEITYIRTLIFQILLIQHSSSCVRMSNWLPLLPLVN